MRTGAKGDTPEVAGRHRSIIRIGRHRSIIRIYVQLTSITRCRVLVQKSNTRCRVLGLTKS